MRYVACTAWTLATALVTQISCATPATPPAQHHAHHPHGMAKQAALGVSAAFAPDGRLWVVGLDDTGKLTARISTDDGRTWAETRTLDTGSDVVAADRESRPKIAFGPNDWVVISYTQPLAKPYTGEIRMLRSTDGGKSFSAPFTVHRDRQLITHRFDAVAFDAQGALHALWIDKRDAEADRASAAARNAKSEYAGAAVYRNVSTDGGRSFGPDLKLADHSCECCRIALARSGDGALVALWRHVYGKNIRDHAFARFSAADSAPAEPVRATFDEWAIDACPHHGPGLAPAADGGYHAVWFGERAGQPGVRYGRLSGTGAPLGKPRDLPDDMAEHADVASSARRVAVAWRSFDGKSTVLRAWTSQDDGATFTLRDIATAQGENDQPRLVAKNGQIFVVWRTASELHVEPLFSTFR